MTSPAMTIRGDDRAHGRENRAGSQTAAAGSRRTWLLARLLRPHVGRLALAVAASVAAELAALALMGTAAWLIARAAQQPPLAALSLAIVCVRAFATARGVFRYGERLASHDVALRALATLRGRVYDALVPLAPSGLPAFRGADLLSRMVADVEAVQDLVVRVMVPVATAVVVAGAAVGFAAAASSPVALVLAAGLAVGGLVVPVLTAAAARRAARVLAPARAELATRHADLLQGSADLTVFGAAERALAAADDAAERLARAERRVALTSAAATAAAMLVQGATTVLVAVVALDAAAAGALPAVMVPVLALVALISFEPVLPLVAAANAGLEARTSIRRVLDVLGTPAPVSEPDEPRPAPGGDVVVEVDGLSVRHPGANRRAVDDVNLWLTPGRRVAVVGPSGAGKSTLVACLMRFIEPESGTVRLNDHDLRDYAGDDVRTVVTGLTQEDHLFHATIRENLRLAKPEAGDDELLAVLRRVRLADWVESLPRGLDTVVGEAGGQVSGGQRRRLGLARALLADPPVLVLDEPTEGVDPAMADELVADLLAAEHGRATLLVTHRLAGLDQADEIVVMRDGQVAQRGTHADLVATPGPYQDLWWASRGATSP